MPCFIHILHKLSSGGRMPWLPLLGQESVARLGTCEFVCIYVSLCVYIRECVIECMQVYMCLCAESSLLLHTLFQMLCVF